MSKKSFIIHIDSLSILDKLSYEQKGRLFDAIHKYHVGDTPELDLLTEVLFEPFKNQFIRDQVKYDKVSGVNKTNGSLGGRPRKDNNKNPLGYFGLNKNPKKADSDNDSDNDSKSDNKKETYPLFEDFWILYDYKKGDKEKVKNKFNRLSQNERDDIMKFLPGYIKSTPDKIYRKHPETFLNNKSWNDEIISKQETSNKKIYLEPIPRLL